MKNLNKSKALLGMMLLIYLAVTLFSFARSSSNTQNARGRRSDSGSFRRFFTAVGNESGDGKENDKVGIY
jgi:threonine/homoserine/homoserine lactone efflux protein